MSFTVEHFSVGPMDNNLYILKDEAAKKLVVVDPSIASEPARERVATLIQEGYEFSAIWNTHGHFDHVYDNSAWKVQFNVPIFASPDDSYFLEHLREQAIWFGMAPPEVVQPDGPLTPASVLAVGTYQPAILAVPGHSPGSLAFYFREAGVCIAGDVLFSGSVGRTDLPGSSAEQLAASLRLLWELPEETAILPGHGPATTLDREKRSNAVAAQLMRAYPAQ